MQKQICMPTHRMLIRLDQLEGHLTVTPNPTSADKDDTYTYTTTLEFFNDGKNYDEKSGTDK